MRQIQALGRVQDVAFAISTSGRSPNVLEALAEARRRQMTTIAMVGSWTDGAAAVADIVIAVPAESAARRELKWVARLRAAVRLCRRRCGQP